MCRDSIAIKSSRSLSMTSSLHKTASASTTQKTYHFDEDETLREVTSVKSTPRQLSFTSTINIEDSSMKLSTDSERPAKRSKPSMEFQGLKLTVPKKIKPLLRKTVSNMDSMNHRSASSPVVLTMEQERVVNLIVKKEQMSFTPVVRVQVSRSFCNDHKTIELFVWERINCNYRLNWASGSDYWWFHIA